MIFKARCMATGRRPPIPGWKGLLRNCRRSNVDDHHRHHAAHQERLDDGSFAAVGEEQDEHEDDAEVNSSTSQRGSGITPTAP